MTPLSLPLCRSVSAAQAGVGVYGAVPGLSPSPYYSMQVRQEKSHTWLDTFTLLTECTGEKFCNTTNMFEILNGWSNSYLNLEIEEGTEVEIKLPGLLFITKDKNSRFKFVLL